ncbi:hypothetical protein LCGC14_2142850 [marine sediment metagenome]|uniref:Uncharacterized protein n=1 Tax=marine sediment metagenome TaxID=412755 RepID=A0A0F9DY46_9ZZZZ
MVEPVLKGQSPLISPSGGTVAHVDTTGRTVDDHHDEAHTVDSHSDTTATGAELDTLTDGSDADALHVHGVWASWSPSYANLTIGNGTVVARYVQIGKTIHAYWELTWGSTTGITGDVTVSTPVTASSQYTTGASEVGIVMFVDISVRTNDTTGHILLASTTTFELFAMVIAGARLVLRPMVNDINPHTWATGDIMSFRAIYEAA